MFNKDQKDYLRNRRLKVTKLREKVIDKYTPAIFENISQVRTTILSLSVTSGAIAAFSINLFDNNLIEDKRLLITAFFLFLIVVLEGYFYLKQVLEGENNQLAKTSDRYNKAISKVRDAIDKVLKDETNQSIRELQKAENDLTDAFTESPDRIDNWFVKNIGDLMLVPFTIAILLVAFSFVDLSQLLSPK